MHMYTHNIYIIYYIIYYIVQICVCFFVILGNFCSSLFFFFLSDLEDFNFFFFSYCTG